MGSPSSAVRTTMIPAMDARSPKARTTSGKRMPLQTKVGIQRHPENHRADVFCRGGLKQIGPTTGAVANIIPDEIGNDRRVARIVFGNARFNFAHQVCPHVGGFGVNATAELRKQRHKTGAKAVADNQKGDFLGWRYQRGVTAGKQTTHAKEAHGHDEQPGDGAATQGNLQAQIQARARCRGSANVGANCDTNMPM